ncbi:MAG: branched-chain amino acid transport system permease protein [Acidimicrobiaceae bacterium]|jgi:branched-chain amino acid transport system permease protein
MDLFLQHLADGLSLGFAYALIGLGFSLVFGTLKFLNFAHSGLLMLSAFVGWAIADEGHGNFFLVLAVSMCVGAVLATVLERALIRPVVGRSFTAPFITTLGASLIMLAVAKSVWNTEPKAFSVPFAEGSLDIGPVRVTAIQWLINGVTVVVMLLLAYLIQRTRLGLMVRAAAENTDMAKAMGVNTGRIASLTMAISGALAGISGTLLAASLGAVSVFAGDIYGLKGMVAMIVGGIGSLRGAVIAGVAIGLGEVMVSAYISSTWRDFFAFGLLIAVLLWRPAGLFGSREDRFVPVAV